MRQLSAFMKKEFLEPIRTGRLLILSVLFCLFGILSPAIAKMTPWMMELMSDQLSQNGLVINDITVNALTSRTQFFKNAPILLIVFILMFSNILTAEYQKGTLVNVITKGMSRWKILAAKLITMAVLWTAGYCVMFGITFGYNAYFWDNHIAHSLAGSVSLYYLAGTSDIDKYWRSAGIACTLAVMNIVLSIVLFNKRRL